MVNWKVALVVVIIIALVMVIGMWFGYRYVSEHDDISPNGWRERTDTIGSAYILMNYLHLPRSHERFTEMI